MNSLLIVCTGRQKHTDSIFNYKKKTTKLNYIFFCTKNSIQKRPVRSLLLPAEILGVQSYLSAAVHQIIIRPTSSRSLGGSFSQNPETMF